MVGRIVTLLFALTLLASIGISAESAGKAEVGKDFVDFTAKTWDDKDFTLSEAIKGKAVIIKFGATWCGWCEKMWPELKKVYDDMGKDVVVIEVDLLNAEKGETKEKVAKSVKEKKTPWTVLLDEGPIQRLYGEGGGIPQSVLIGKDGRFRKHVSGFKEFSALKPMLDACIKNTPFPGEVGSTMADFTLTDTDDKEFKLADHLKRGPVVLKFGATWCGPCQAMIPTLNDVVAKHGKKATVVEADLLNDARGETKSKVKEHKKKSGAKYRILFDDGKLFGTMGADGIPLTLVINKYGIVEARLEGQTEYAAIEEALEKAYKAVKPAK